MGPVEQHRRDEDHVGETCCQKLETPARLMPFCSVPRNRTPGCAPQAPAPAVTSMPLSARPSGGEHDLSVGVAGREVLKGRTKVIERHHAIDDDLGVGRDAIGGLLQPCGV